MRRARKHPEKSTMPINEERVASLDALGFDWSVSEQQAAKKSFEQRKDLWTYKEKHGNLNVKWSEDKSLHHFCKDIRYARKYPEASRRNLTTKDITSLNALGFDWRMS